MTLYAIEGYIAPDTGMTDTEAQAAVDDWVSKRTKWSGETQAEWDATVRRKHATEGGSPYLHIEIRFESDSDTKDNLLQKFGDKFANKVDWFRVCWHECDHDEADRQGCSWGEKREWVDKNVTVPSDVERAIPDAETVVQHQ